LALRICTLVEEEEKKKITEAFFEACWKTGLDISSENVIKTILKELGYENTTEIIEKANSMEMKKKLNDQTSQAIKEGVFGIPSFKIDNEVIWGQDRIHYIKDYLEGTDPFSNQPNIFSKIFDYMNNIPRGIDRKEFKKLNSKL
jgi:2-hydroxychromene-2-carboxylate isomerase